MPQRPSTLDRFLTRVRVRWIVWRTVECSGIGIAVATVLGLILTPILFLQNQPAWPVVISSMALGAITGAIATLRRLPSRFDVAMELDQQLRLADLIASAVMTRKSTDSESASWRHAVLASADARVRTIRPCDLILHRLGVRAWSGIGLGSAITITLALMQGNPQSTLARAEGETTNRSAHRNAPLVKNGNYRRPRKTTRRLPHFENRVTRIPGTRRASPTTAPIRRSQPRAVRTRPTPTRKAKARRPASDGRHLR